MEEQFIKQTAKDYDLSYKEVSRVYYMYGGTPKFYEQLELIIECRQL